MIKIYTAPTSKPKYAVLIDDERGLVSQVYLIQAPILSTEISQTKFSNMLDLHTKQTQLLANENYWLWPIDENTNQFPPMAKQHQKI